MLRRYYRKRRVWWIEHRSDILKQRVFLCYGVSCPRTRFLKFYKGMEIDVGNWWVQITWSFGEREKLTYYQQLDALRILRR